MSLAQTLQEMAAASAKKFPEDKIAIMKRTTAAVADSIASRNIPGVGDALPAFELPDSQGNIVKSSELASQGNFVVTFFRGMW